jgi:hypothetical protein
MEAMLSALARVERAPELSEDLRRRIARTPRRQVGWAWAAGVAVAVVVTVGAIGLTARPQRHKGTKGAAQWRNPQIAQMTQVAGGNEKPKDAATGVVTGRISTKAQGDPRSLELRRAGRREGVVPSASLRAGLPLRSAQGQDDNGLAGGELPSTALRAGLQKDERAAGVGTPALQGGGVILVLGRPEAVQVSGSCYMAVTSGDGTRAAAEQAVERDAAGRARMVRVAYEQTEPNARSGQQGG